MAIKAATVINKEKNSVITTVSINDIIGEIADAVFTIRSYAFDTLSDKIYNLDFPWCKLIEFPELCYQHIKNKIPKPESSSQQKKLKDIAKVIIISETLMYMDSHQRIQSFFLLNSRGKADFLYQTKALEKEIKYLLNVYSGAFLSLCNKHDKGEVNLEQKDLSACNYFLSISKEVLEYNPSTIPNINSFSCSVVMSLFDLAKKDFKTYKSYLANDRSYVYELIKNDAIISSFLNDLYKMKMDEEKFKYNYYCEDVKVLLVQVFLATYKKNTNLKDSEVREFLLENIDKIHKHFHESLRDLMALHGI